MLLRNARGKARKRMFRLTGKRWAEPTLQDWLLDLRLLLVGKLSAQSAYPTTHSNNNVVET